MKSLSKLKEETELQGTKHPEVEDSMVDVEKGAASATITMSEPWQQSDEDLGTVPVKTIIKVKERLKGRISERDDEIQSLKEKIAKMESSMITKDATQGTLAAPKPDDFLSDDEYQEAIVKYHSDVIDTKIKSITSKADSDHRAKEEDTQRVRAVDAHYERAAELIEKSQIDPDLYKQTDAAVRSIIESVVPKKGDAIVDHLIAKLGKGSEKVLFFVGRNKSASEEVKQLLIQDPTGVELAMYLGQQKERLTRTNNTTSSAPKPATVIKGDGTVHSGSADEKKYQAAHKSGNIQAAYNIKKAAKNAGVDVSTW